MVLVYVFCEYLFSISKNLLGIPIFRIRMENNSILHTCMDCISFEIVCIFFDKNNSLLFHFEYKYVSTYLLIGIPQLC